MREFSFSERRFIQKSVKTESEARVWRRSHRASTCLSLSSVLSLSSFHSHLHLDPTRRPAHDGDP